MCGRTAVPVRRAVFSSSSMSAGEGHSASFFSFAPSCLLPAFSCPYHPVVSYRLRPVEALRGGRRGVGRYASADRWRDLASRFSSRPIVSLCGSFDFPVSTCGQDTCAVFVSSFSCVIRWRQGGSFSFSSRPSSRCSVSRGRLVLILCWSLVNPFYLVDLPVSRCSVSLSGPSLVPSSCSSFFGVLSC